jgi:5-formyltetrahydrofolate cyclo-ligase
MTKQEIRILKITERKNLSSKFRVEASYIIATKLFDKPEFQNAKIVHVYKSLEFEVDTTEIINKCFELNKRVVVPVTNSDCSQTNHYEIFPDTAFEKLHFGVLVPAENYIDFDLSEMSSSDIFIIPLLAFDSENNRIGYGKGCYDSFLKKAKGHKLGIAFACQKVERIEVEDHDVKMDKVICE